LPNCAAEPLAELAQIAQERSHPARIRTRQICTIYPMDSSLGQSWDSFAALCSNFYAGGGGAQRVLMPQWYAALSRLRSAELNVCGLKPCASAKSASDLVETLGPFQPAIVFTSAHLEQPPRIVLTDAGFTPGETPEPLMLCRDRPEAVP
jgi:hypothetical protein